jgi:hypothetical protein
LEEAMDEGIKIGGNLLKDVRFTDDQGMIAGSEIGLIQKIMDGLYTHYCTLLHTTGFCSKLKTHLFPP